MTYNKYALFFLFIFLTGSLGLFAQGAPGALMITPNPINFGDVGFGTSSEINVYISRADPFDLAPAGINAIDISGSPFFDESHAFALPSSYSSTESKMILVSYNPSTPGTHTGTLTITNSYGVVYDIPITGTYLAPVGVPTLEIRPATLYGSVMQDTVSTVNALFVNTGSADLTYDLVTTGLPDWLSFGNYYIEIKSGTRNITGTIAPGDSAYIPVHFDASESAPGDFYFSATVNTNETYPVHHWSIYMLVDALPVKAEFIANPVDVHVGDPVYFYDQSVVDSTATGTFVNSRAWDFEDDGSYDSNAVNPMIVYATVGYYSVKLRVTSNLGDVDTEIKPDYINVYNNPPVAADSMSTITMDEDGIWGPMSLFGLFDDPDGDTMTFAGTSGNYVNMVITGAMYSIVPKGQWYGVENVYIRATDQFGASTLHTFTVTVEPVNDDPVLSIPPDIYFINDSHLSVNFADYVDDIDNPDSEVSMTISHAVAGEDDISVVYSPDVPGSLTAMFTNTVPNWSGVNDFQICFNDNAGRSIVCTQVTFHSLDHFITTFAFNDSLNLAGQTIQFTDTTLGNPDWWLWDYDNDGTPDSSEQNPTHQFMNGGDYTIRLTLGNYEAGEQDSALTPFPFNVIGTALVGDLPPNLPIDGSPYNVVDSLYIPTGGTTIDPNVVLNFLGTDPVELNGSLFANGAFFQAPPGGGFWGGLVFGEGSQGSNFDGCHFFDALNPLVLNGYSPTLHNLEIAVSDTTQFINEAGIFLDGSSANLNNIRIRNYRKGITIGNTRRTPRTTPTLTNIRVRNSEETSRTRAENFGLSISGDVSVSVTDAEIINCTTAIMLDNQTRTTTTPTLTNIRVRNSSETSRVGNFGIKVSGDISATVNDAVLEECGIALRYDKTGTYGDRTGTTPTLTNIRVRNSSETQRSETIGIQLIDLDRVIVNNDSIGNCTKAVEVINSNRTDSTPTLTNIRVRNSSETQRFANIGIHLHSGVAGRIENCDIQGAYVGIQLEDGARPEFLQNYIKNCATGIKAFSTTQAQPIKKQIIALENAFVIDHPTWVFRALDLNHAGPWRVYNNTIFNYPSLLMATNAAVEFTSNIGWGWSDVPLPFIPIGSTIAATYNDVRLSQGMQLPGIGNINLYPVFFAPTQDDFSITYESPCIDAGSPLLPPDPDGSRVDIGAKLYEHRASMTGDQRFVITGTTINFTNTSLGHNLPGETSVAWDLGNDGNVDSTSRNWTHTFDTPGLYDIRLRMQTGSLIDEVVYSRAVVVQDLQLMPPVILTPTMLDGGIRISWEPVLQTVMHDPVTVSYYLIYHGDAPDGDFHYLGFTEAPVTSFWHGGGLTGNRDFYFVIGYAGTRSQLQNYIETHGTVDSRGKVKPIIRESLR